MDTATDPGTRSVVQVRCVEPTEYDPNDGEPLGYEHVGCGWTGNTVALTQYGCTGYLITDCPDCGGRIEPTEEDPRRNAGQH